MIANFTFLGSPENIQLIIKLAVLFCPNNLALFKMLYYFCLIHKTVSKKLKQQQMQINWQKEVRNQLIEGNYKLYLIVSSVLFLKEKILVF